MISLRTDLASQVNSKLANDGIYSRLSDIGLSIDEKFQISVSDSTKFNDAVQNHLGDVKNLLDAKMGKIDTLLTRYTGTSGIVTTTSNGLDDEIKVDNDRITKMNEKLAKRKDALTNQYLSIQNEMASLTYLQQEMELFASYYTSSSS